MKRNLRLPFLSLLLLATTACASHEAIYKPGLWEISRQTDHAKGKTVVEKRCVGKETRSTNKDSCSKRSVARQGAQTTIDSVCSFRGSSITTHEVITHSGSDAYHGVETSRIDPPIHGLSETVSMEDGKWIGPCPADMKPGDMLLPDGTKVRANQRNGGQS